MPIFRYKQSLLKSSSSESLASEENTESLLVHFNDDPELPIYSHTPTGYSLPKLVDILMISEIPDEKIRQVQPMGVNRNCSFIIDLDSICLDDLKADDLGSWKSTGIRRSYFKLNQGEEAEFVKMAPSESADYFEIVRRYFVHSTYSKFRRCIVEIKS